MKCYRDENEATLVRKCKDCPKYVNRVQFQDWVGNTYKYCECLDKMKEPPKKRKKILDECPLPVYDKEYGVHDYRECRECGKIFHAHNREVTYCSQKCADKQMGHLRFLEVELQQWNKYDELGYSMFCKKVDAPRRYRICSLCGKLKRIYGVVDSATTFCKECENAVNEINEKDGYKYRPNLMELKFILGYSEELHDEDDEIRDSGN